MNLSEFQLSLFELNEFPHFPGTGDYDDRTQGLIDCSCSAYETSLFALDERTFDSAVSQQFNINEVNEVANKNEFELEINVTEIKSTEDIIIEFNLLIQTSSFSEAKNLIDSLLTRVSRLGRLLSLSLLRLQLFECLKLGQTKETRNLYHRIRSYDDHFATKNGYLEGLIKSPQIFDTTFYKSEKSNRFFPAIQALALYLICIEGLLSTSVTHIDTLVFDDLENLEEEMVFYMLTFKMIFKSIGEYDEVYLDHCSSYNCDNFQIKSLINQESNKQINENSEDDIFPPKRTVFTTIKLPPRSIKISTDCISCYHTHSSEETSVESKQTADENTFLEELYQYKLPKVPRNLINKRIFKHFKKYLKSAFKNKTIEYSKLAYDFSQNNLRTPLTIEGKKFASYNNSYMHWLFSNKPIASLYSVFIDYSFGFVVDDLINTYEIESPKDRHYLKEYVKEIPILFKNNSLQISHKKRQEQDKQNEVPLFSQMFSLSKKKDLIASLPEAISAKIEDDLSIKSNAEYDLDYNEYSFLGC